MAHRQIACLVASALQLMAVAAAVAGDRASQIDLGRQIFEQSWLRPPADDSPLAVAKGGDGLGPMFNGASCVECHRLGGSGGAGPNEHNVDVISLVVPFGASEDARRKLRRHAATLHPAFRNRSDVVLHKLGIDKTGEFDAYAEFRTSILDQFPEVPQPASATQFDIAPGVSVQLAQRNTPAMFGNGVVDRVPPELLKRLAAVQRSQTPDQAGRPALGGAGRFGWRGQVGSLEEFVRTACAEECGLRVKSTGRMIIDQPPLPLDLPRARPTHAPVDLSEEHVDALVAFSASLPAPTPVPPDDLLAAASAEQGRRTFGEIGCAVCHVEHVGPASHIYSDLLLHDMGPILADRVKAPSTDASVSQFSSEVMRTTSYYGSETTGSVRLTKTFVDPPSLNEIETTAREWKTPPLWGVADSAPYLHDGRAETLDDAIRQHGGQGAESVVNYNALDDEGRSDLIVFLNTLKAPQID